jgi:hypothetical protein
MRVFIVTYKFGSGLQLGLLNTRGSYRFIPDSLSERFHGHTNRPGFIGSMYLSQRSDARHHVDEILGFGGQFHSQQAVDF